MLTSSSVHNLWSGYMYYYVLRQYLKTIMFRDEISISGIYTGNWKMGFNIYIEHVGLSFMYVLNTESQEIP